MFNRIIMQLRTPLYVSSYLLIAMRALGTIFGFVFWAVAARLMPVEDLGKASGVMAATMLLAALAQLGLGYGLTRHLPKSEDPNRLVSLTLVVTTLVSFLLAVIFLAGLPWWSPVLLPLFRHPLYPVFFIGLVVNWSLTMLLNWIFIARRGVIYSLTRQGGHQLIAIILMLVFYQIIPNFGAVMFAHTIAAFVSVLFAWQALPKVLPNFRFTFSVNDLFHPWIRKTFARYSFINYIGDQFNRIPDTVLPLLIINQFGPATGAYFFIVWTIGRAVATWVSSMAQSAFAEGAMNPEESGAMIKRASVLGIALSGAMAIGMLIGGPLLLGIYGREYVEQGLGLLSFVAISAVPTVLIALFMSLLMIRDRLRALMVLRMVDTTVGLVFIYIGIIQLGFVGAGIGWLIWQVMLLAGCHLWWQWQKRQGVVEAVPATIEQVERGA